MTETIPAPYINKPETGYLYVALLSESAQNHISELLRPITDELPSAIWPMPPQALHITLCEIVQSRKQYSDNKDDLFAGRRDEYIDGARDVVSSLPSFSVTFDQIEVNKEAIIVRTSESDSFNDIRAKLLGHIILPSETKQPPDITHSTIARYRQAIDIDKVQSVVNNYSINIIEDVTEFKLVKSTIPPLLKYQELASFPLKN